MNWIHDLNPKFHDNILKLYVQNNRKPQLHNNKCIEIVFLRQEFKINHDMVLLVKQHTML